MSPYAHHFFAELSVVFWPHPTVSERFAEDERQFIGVTDICPRAPPGKRVPVGVCQHILVDLSSVVLVLDHMGAKEYSRTRQEEVTERVNGCPSDAILVQKSWVVVKVSGEEIGDLHTDGVVVEEVVTNIVVDDLLSDLRVAHERNVSAAQTTDDVEAHGEDQAFHLGVTHQHLDVFAEVAFSDGLVDVDRNEFVAIDRTELLDPSGEPRLGGNGDDRYEVRLQQLSGALLPQTIHPLVGVTASATMKEPVVSDETSGHFVRILRVSGHHLYICRS